jgi:phage terminase Nu1 subunit (DNA packaging protein)
VRKICAKKGVTRVSNTSYLTQTLALHTRQLALKRQRIRLERRKVEALELIAATQQSQLVAMNVIANELVSVRTAYASVNGITFSPFTPVLLTDAEV